MENYHMYNEIGRGTHSSVYKARRKRSIEYVAIKSTAKSRMDKILNEVLFLHKLDSPYVLKFVDWYESSNHIWLILEYCVGSDLLNLITQDKQLPESVVKSFGLDLVAGLQYLHANSILYCDLKPGNVLIDEFGSLKLADFGLARRIPGSGTPPARPLAPGSPHYMAPELFQQTAVHSFASDFWALGCVLYELRTGRQPFIHTTFSELARMIQTEAVQLPLSECDMSLEFCDLLRRLLEKDPYQRITWDELLVHPFWDGLPRLANVDVPRQPIFEKGSPMSLNRDRDCENAWSANKSDADLDDAYDKDSPKISIAQEQKQPPIEGEAVAADDEIGCSSHGLSDSFQAIQDHVATSAIKNEVRAPILETHDLPNDHVEPDDGTDDDIQGGSDKLTGHRRRRQRPMMPQVVPAASRHVRGQRMQGHQVQLSGLFDRSGASGSWLRRISTLVFTAEDGAVKPIIGNADTKLDDSPPFEAKLLRFAVVSPEVLLSCTEETLQNHLTEVYTSLSSHHSDSSETLSCMAYLHSLSRHTRLADAIVKGSILGLLIRMLAQEVQLATSSETMLSMLCLMLGHLFQSTTVIALSSPDQLRQLLKILLTVAADLPIRAKDKKTTSKNESQSRSRALACLGELLLYMLTKKKWELPVDGMNAVLFGIEDPDIATRYYATRTLCNMLTHATESLLPKLVRGKVVLALIRGLLQWDTPVFDDQGHTHERRLLVALRTTITETLAQVLRHVCTPSSSACLPSRLKRSIKLYFAKPDVLNAVWQGVESPRGSSDLVLASLNVINAFLAMELVRDREAEHAAIQSSRALLLGRIVKMPAIQNVMVMNGPTADDNEDGECLAMLQAKSLMLLHLGIQLNRDFLTSFVQNDSLVLVEETLGTIAELLNAGHSILASPSPGDKFSMFEMYLTQCAFNLCKLLIELALEFGAGCFRTCGDDNKSNREMNGLQASPMLFQLFRGLLRHSNCRQRLLNYFTTSDSTQYTIFVRRMAKLLTLFPDKVISIFGELETETTIACSVSEILLLLFQSAAREANDIVLVDEHELFTHLLPVVVQLVYGDKKSMNGQAADNYLKLLHVVLLDFDYDDEKGEYKLYDPFIRSILLPYLSDALKRHDTMDERIWNLSSELLYGLLSSDTSLVSEAENLDLVSMIVNMLCVPVTFTSLPSNSVQLVQILMDSADVNLDWLYESGIARGMVIGLTLAAKQKQVDESLVDLVVIFLTLLQHQFGKTRQPGVTPAPLGFNDLVACGPLLLQLCTCGDETHLNRQPEGLSLENKTKAHDMALEVVDVSSRCLVLLSRLFCEQLNVPVFAQNKTFSSLPDDSE